MVRRSPFRHFVFGLCILLLAVVLACGEETTPTATPGEPTATAPPSADIQEAATQAAAPAPAATQTAATPVATPTPEATAPARMEPQGTLEIAVGAVGSDVYLPKSQDYNTAIYDERVTHETIFTAAPDGTRLGRLVKSWEDEIGSDGTFVRTFNLEEGVKWHQRYGDFGEWNADDFIHSFQNVSAEGSRHTTSTSIRDSFFCDGCSLTKIDDMTVRLERPSFDVALDFYTVFPNAIMSMRSKKHFDAVGEATAEHQSVGTGPWELMEVSLNEKKVSKAVRGHWRKTPEWDEFVWWEIGEESTKYANFVTGIIQTGQFSADSIQSLKGETLEGVEFGVFPGADLHYLHLHGANYYPDHAYHQPGPGGEDPVLPTGENSSYEDNCDAQPWISCNRDLNSVEWENARKVRLAMAMAIDRDKLVNNLAFGEGEPAYVFNFLAHTGRLKEFGLDKLVWQYDPERAKQLLTEAGYPDGFDIDIWDTETGGRGALPVNEAVGGMWEAVGISTQTQIMQFQAFIPLLVARTALGVRADIQGVAAPSPLRHYKAFYNAANRFTFSPEHPALQELVDKALNTPDEQERWGVEAEIATWLFDQVGTIPLYEGSSIWPFGPELGRWDVNPLHVEWLNNWEYAPHK